MPRVAVDKKVSGVTRVRVPGYSIYAHIRPMSDDISSIALIDHLTDSIVCTATVRAHDTLLVAIAEAILIAFARKDGISVEERDDTPPRRT